MTDIRLEPQAIATLDLLAIEREARAARARFIAEMFSMLRRSISARLQRGAQAHTA